MLAKLPEQIAVVDVLRVVQRQEHDGSRAFAMGTDRISLLLRRRDAAVRGALEGITLRHLIADQPLSSASDEEWDSLVEAGDAAVDKSGIVSPTVSLSDSNPEERPASLPTQEKWRSN
jgi:hypothetical protein